MSSPVLCLRSVLPGFAALFALLVASHSLGADPDAKGSAGPAGAAAGNPFLPSGVEDRGWPHLRGPDYDGRSKEIHLADAWPPDGPPVLWTRSLGQGYSGFTAFGDRVYTQVQSLAGQSVVCLDADSGETVWEYRYDWPFEAAGIYPGPRATPTYDSGRIYFAGPSGLVGCLSADRGKLLWSMNVKERFRGHGTDFGYSISPTVEQGRVILPVGGKGASLVALDAVDGSIVWQSGDAAASYTPALPITLEGERRIVALMENTLAGYDFQSGRQLWSIYLSQGYDEHSAWPVYSEPYVLICSPFRSGSQLYELTAGDAASARLVRVSPVMSNDIFSSILVDGSLYGFDLKDIQAKAHRPSRGTFRCLNFLTGEQHWETDRVGHATVLEADGKLVLFNDTGELILARASSEAYHELGRAQVLGGEICWTQPTLHRGRLYVRNQSQAACVYLGAPELLETRTTAVPLSVADIPQTKYRDWTAMLGVEPEYAFDVPSREWLRDWFVLSLIAVLLPAGVLAGISARASRRVGRIGGWWIFWGAAFLLGAGGTTALSLWRNEFTFLWPVCVFVAFQAMVYQSRWGIQQRVSHPRLWSYAALIGFLAVCLAYYLLCRRLSLVTEWAFLCGFPVAVPFALAGASFSHRRYAAVAAIVATVASFAAFYWGAVALLMWKY